MNEVICDNVKPSTHIGTIGTRVSFGLVPKKSKNQPICVSESPLILKHVNKYETVYGYLTELVFCTKEGLRVVYKTKTHISKDDIGKQYTLIGTIKNHNKSYEVKQTVMSRCIIERVNIRE